MSGTSNPVLKRFLEQFPRLAHPSPVILPATNRDQIRQGEGAQAKQRDILIEKTIRNFEQVAAALQADIRAEEKRARSYDPEGDAYPVIARAMRERQQNLRQSIRKLHRELAAARLSRS